MRLKVCFDKDVAFCGYVWHVANLNRWPWTARGPLAEVPKKLAQVAAEITEYPPFHFEHHPAKELSDRTQRVLSIITRLERLFNRQWKKYRRDVEYTHKLILKFKKIYGEEVLRIITEITKIPWTAARAKSIWLIPALYQGGVVFGNKIFIGGYADVSIEKFASVAIHEILHVNTNPVRGKIRLEYKDSNEIAIVLLTNKIIDLLNRKLEANLSEQDFHVYMRKKLHLLERKLKALGIKDYISLVKKIDKILKAANFKSTYEPHT